MLHCEGASSRGGCRAQRAPGGARRAWAVMVAASPRPGFKLQAHTCRGPSAVSQDEGKIGFHCPLAPLWSFWGPRLHMGAELGLSAAGHRNIRSALVAGSYQGLLGVWGASRSSVSPEMHAPSGLGVFRGGERE